MAGAERSGHSADRKADTMETLNERGNTMKTTEQQQENVKRWVTALRSGSYVQGRGCLRSADDEFCCLGVANDLFGEWSVPWAQSSVTECWAGPDSDRYIIRDDILEDWFGEIDEHKHNVSWYGFNNVLAAANDGSDNTPALTFHEIADLIETTLASHDPARYSTFADDPTFRDYRSETER